MASKAPGNQAEKSTSAIGEVISSSITDFITELWSKDADQLIQPSFGCFLRAESTEEGINTYAIVYNIVTGPFDAQHKPSALGLSRKQLKTEQPHIFSLLQTQIHTSIIGFGREAQISLNLPPRPPQVHDFVYPCTGEEVRALTEDFSYLRLLSNVTSIPADELLTASIRCAQPFYKDDRSFLVEAGRALALLYRDDYDRLVSILKKIRPG